MIRQPRFRYLAFAVGLALAPAIPASAQADQTARPVAPPPAPASSSAVTPRPDHPAYGDLYAAMEGSVDQGMMVDKALVVLGREFAASEEFKLAEAESPGLIKEMIDNLRPIFVAQSERVRLLYRPSTIALLARHLTPDEATSIAAFYRSDLGRKLMGGMVENYSPDATLSNLQTEAPVTADQVKEDISNATERAISAMSQDDLMELGRMAMARPELLKLSLIGKGVQQLRAQMENEPLTAEEDAAIVAVVEDVFGRRFPAE
jgi:hypothetical protein